MHDPGSQSVAQMVEQDREEDQSAFGGTDQVHIHAVEGERIVQHAQEERAAQHADRFSHASVETAPAEDGAREGHHDKAGAHVVGDSVLASRSDQTRNRGQKAGQYKGVDHHPLCADSGDKGGTAVAAGQQKAPSHSCLAEEEFKDGIDDHQCQYGDLERTDFAPPQKSVDRIQFCQGERNQKEHKSSHDDLGGHGEQERIGLELHQAEAVKKSHRRADDQGDQYADKSGQADGFSQQDRQAGRKGQGGLHGEVQLSDHHDNALSQDHESQCRGLEQNIQQVAAAQEGRSEHGVQEKEHRDHDPYQVVEQSQLYFG